MILIFEILSILFFMETIWKNNLHPFGTLESNVKFDVAVIGGGIAGLWCAYHLMQAGQKVCILEAKRIGSGVTSGSTAILTYAQDIILHPLIQKHGENVAAKYLSDTQSAIAEIQKIIQNEKFQCDFQPVDFVLFSTKNKGKKELKKEKEAYASLGHSVEEVTEPSLPYKVKKALKFNHNFQFDPLKLCGELARWIEKNGGKIFENMPVTMAPKENNLNVGKYTVTAKNFVVATHFPYINVPGFYWLKMYQSQNYCLAFMAKDKKFASGISYESIDETGFEYRRVGDVILCDGVSIRTGEKPYHSKYRMLQKHISKHFENAQEVVRYCAQDCITMDHLPYAGRYSHFQDNVFVVTGFNKWGMTNSFITTKTVSDMITGKLAIDAPPDENIYSPQRAALFVNLIETISNIGVIGGAFANNLLNLDAKKFSRIQAGQGAIVKHKGRRLGVSRGKDGTLNVISGICPHLGCNLTWNKDECTFDCPCHGSRFDTKGNIINNPSVKNAEKW